jgi:predicted phosphodiesterase
MRAALLSDIHSNLEALDAVLEHARTQDVAATVVLGDIVGYNADPNAVVARLKELRGATLIAGNHDLAATGRYDVADFNSVAAAAIGWTTATMNAHTRGALMELQPRADEALGLLVHGSVVDPAIEYVFNTEAAGRSFEAEPFALCFFGHTHMPTCFSRAERGEVTGVRLLDEQTLTLDAGARYMLNPGSVGQPRDGDPRASYMVYDSGARTATVHRVYYDIERTQRKIVDGGLPPVLAERLAVGR